MMPITFATPVAVLVQDGRADRLPLHGQTQEPPARASVTALPAATAETMRVITFSWRGDGRHTAEPA
ncbi:hypothetical protein [Motilibacter aurantiacus]|uniref:hypothetical protein n=1 Tax=Motilibacter aurantiacus TaxID=2714955 RepID=UPI00140DFCFE|nr:hypothetical protein [Motilibacter aurantiacus]NHC47290.1 hypothetical protein [Motilibacter aurantiacus]